MDLIKKKVLLNTGNTSGYTCNFNILLTVDIKDLGFFDTLDDIEMTGTVVEEVARTTEPYTGDTYEYSFIYPSSGYSFNNYSGDSFLLSGYTATTVTGTSSSRLSELEKYTISTNPYVKYFTGGTINNDGLSSYTGNTSYTGITYYIGGIRYIDETFSGSTATTTTFSFSYSGFSEYNFDNKRILKLESKLNMVENSQVNSDVFIVRQQQSAFEKNYRLRSIGSLSNLIKYAGGNYFKIFNNT